MTREDPVGQGREHLSPWRWWALVAAAWLLFGLGSGTLEWLAVQRHRGLAWAGTVWSAVLASAIWIPLTLGCVIATRRWPLWPVCARHLTLHLAFSLLVSFVLNFFWAAGAATLSSAGYPEVAVRWGDVVATTWSMGLLNLPLNGGAYWGIALLITLWDQRRPGTPARADRIDGAWATTLTVKRNNEVLVVPVREIDWIEGAGDYARLHVGGEELLSNERLKELEKRLDPATFARVHRSAIVNLTRIRALSHQSHGDYLATLAGGTQVRVARSRSKSVQQIVNGRQRPGGATGEAPGSR